MPTYSNTGDVSYVLQNPARTLAPGATGFETPLILDHLDGVERTADTPRYNMLRDRTNLAFTEAGSQTVTFAAPHLIAAILISTTVAVDMYMGAATNTPGKRLLADREYWLEPNGLIDALVFTAGAAGSVVVEEVGRPDAAVPGETEVAFGGMGVTFGGKGVVW